MQESKPYSIGKSTLPYSVGKGVYNLGQSTLPYSVGKGVYSLPWDGSCIPEDKVPVGYESSDTGMFEVIIDILKGVFFLPQIGMHVKEPCSQQGKDGTSVLCSQQESKSPKDGTSILSSRVILRYNNGVKLNDGSIAPDVLTNMTNEIRKVIVFQWMFRLKVGGVNEEYIELFQTPGVHFVTTRCKDSSSGPTVLGSDELTKPILQKWFDGDINKFSEILGDMLRPYSRELLQRKIERVIGAYHPEMLKRDDIKTWLKSVYDTVFPYT